MTRSERLNWFIVIVGLLASLTTICGFILNIVGHRSEAKPPPLVTVQKPAVAPPTVRSNNPSTKVGTQMLADQSSKAFGYVGGRLSIRHSKKPKPESEGPAPANP